MGSFEIEMPPLVVRGGREETADLYLKSDELVPLNGLVHGSAPPKQLSLRCFILFIGGGIYLGFHCDAAAKRSFPLRRN